MSSPQEIFTRQEAAQFLRVSVPQVDNWARSGKLVRVKLGRDGRSRVLYRRSDLLAFIDEHVVDTPEEDAEAM